MVVKTQNKYIIKNKEICGGEPIIKGTRIPVRIIFNMYEDSLNTSDIIEAYPHLSTSQIHDDLSYAYDNIKEIRELIEKSTAS